MDSYRVNKLKNIAMIVAFAFGIALQFIGQRMIGYPGMALQMVSLAIMLVVLDAYNRRYR